MSQNSKVRASVAVMGMGAMGSRMATRLIHAGHQVTVWNRTAANTVPLVELGATAAETPIAAVTDAEFVISMVRDDCASRDVWLHPEFGALPGMQRGAIAIESSTLTVDWIEELARKFRERHLMFLDAPVVGTRPQAEAGQLIYLLGGDSSVIARARPIFQATGSAVHHAGAVGSGAAVKLAINTLFAAQVAMMAELIGLLQRSTVNETKAIEIMSTTPVCSAAAKGAADAMLAGNVAPLFPIELVEKDLTYAARITEKYSAHTPIAKTALHVFRTAKQEGYEKDNITGVAKLFEKNRRVSQFF